jgi:catechol 2,3-dioxygenase-like lactoylglutathione lyase family enzyme
MAACRQAITQKAGENMPKLDGILETALYTEDIVKTRRFYEEIMELAPIFADDRLCAYGIAGRDVLLLFRRGTTEHTVTMPGGTIPGHGGSGRLHVAFAIARSELPEWEQRLASHGVVIEGRTDWSRGGHSIYFRDPDGHLLELATPGLWTVY